MRYEIYSKKKFRMIFEENERGNVEVLLLEKGYWIPTVTITKDGEIIE